MARFRVLVVVLVVGVVSALSAGSAGASTVFRTFVAPVTGSDANDCSRAAPCLTLQRALNQVQAHGTVTVLESGVLGQGATVSKAVTVNVPAGIDAGLSRSTGTLLVVNAPTSAIVTINGLGFDGHGTATMAISYTSGQALTLSRISISDFSSASTTSCGINSQLGDLSTSCGVYAVPATSNTHLKTYLNDSSISGTGTAVYLFDGDLASTSSFATLDNDRLEGNQNGVTVHQDARAQVVHSTIAGNGLGRGVQTLNSPGSAVVVGSTITDNNYGLQSCCFGPIYASHSTITGNNTGVAGSAVYTGGDNILIGNGTNGSFAGPIPLK